MMKWSRREWMKFAGIGGSMLADFGAWASSPQVAGAKRTTLFPDRNEFGPMSLAYLDSGSQHPVSHGARAAINAYLAKRALNPQAMDYQLDEDGLKAKFARLVNATPEELCFVQSTTAGEQIVLRALGFPERSGHIITDTLHFFGSIPLYLELRKKGVEVTWVEAREGRIRPEDIRKAMRKDTRLVALSQVSTINGFEHDLKRVCDIAHAGGALVYADIIHAAGCVPVDLHGSGVDFAATASYKWLMGDFGLGFLYCRKDLLPRLKRVNFGYYGLAAFQPHIYPLDPPGDMIAEYGFTPDATGAFALGTYAHTVIAQLHASLDYIDRLGIDAIQAHAQTLCARLKEELPQRGYALMTPKESRAPMVACVAEKARERLGPAMEAAGVRITLSANRFRVSTSTFNGMDDIDRLLRALPKA